MVSVFSLALRPLLFTGLLFSVLAARNGMVFHLSSDRSCNTGEKFLSTTCSLLELSSCSILRLASSMLLRRSLSFFGRCDCRLRRDSFSRCALDSTSSQSDCLTKAVIIGLGLSLPLPVLGLGRRCTALNITLSAFSIFSFSLSTSLNNSSV